MVIVRLPEKRRPIRRHFRSVPPSRSPPSPPLAFSDRSGFMYVQARVPRTFNSDYQGGHTPVSDNALLCTRCSETREPLFGEGLYYAIKSAQIAPACRWTMINQMPPSGEQDEDTCKVINRITSGIKVTRLLYRFPRYVYHLFKTDNTLVQSYFKVLCGENSFVRFYSVIRRKALTNILSCRFQ